MTTIGSLVQNRPVFAVQRTDSVFDTARYMADKNVGAIAVLDGTRLVGIFSERDLITRVIARELDPKKTTVAQVMTKDLVVADATESEESCLKKMKAANCRHLPVISGETLVGLLSLRDLLLVELTERDEKLEFLNSYLFHVPPEIVKKP
ncbi:MAG: CBS domain-containing protein [Ignavibacteriae bacterium]|nr:CBS domain-containing protein [Ignavibacteria bacterium]MBI3365195.1 CBS domain-containing protein [Ignavibacteriota bacterium]